MTSNEVRYRTISALLQASGPLSCAELAVQCDVPEGELLLALRTLVDARQVVEGAFSPDVPGPQYRWAVRWEREAQRRTTDSIQKLRAAVRAAETEGGRSRGVDSEPARAFVNYVIREYRPPADKRWLVFVQCSVKRPFSSSPSHASIRRAISLATGFDPRDDFERCPVHVVVLASEIGPVPYELEDIHPATVRGGGVKQMDQTAYALAKPLLAERMAQYLVVHRDAYDRIATFTEGRYGAVMVTARHVALADFPILPVLGGPRVLRMGRSRPRTYWERFWIQLYLEIAGRLEPGRREQAEARLRGMEVDYV